MRRYGEIFAIGSIVGGIFICDPPDRLRGRNSDFGMPTRLPAFDRLVVAQQHLITYATEPS